MVYWDITCNASMARRFQLLLNQLSANVSLKSTEHGPIALAPSANVGEQDGVPGFWLWPGPACTLWPLKE